MLLFPIPVVVDSWLVVPGRSIGGVRIGDTPEMAFSALGSPDYGDAAMQKSWSTWVGKNGGRVDAFVMNDRAGTSQELRNVHLVRVTSARFHLANGLRAGSAVAALRRAYPAARSAGSYGSPSGRIVFWDDVRRGLAWESSPNGKAIALIVHTAGTPMTASAGPYLGSPLHKG